MEKDIDGYDANGEAFQNKETRVGVPLDYVAEKQRSALECLKDIQLAVERHLPDDFPIPDSFSAMPEKERKLFSAKQDLFVSPIFSGFRYAVISYLALNNMLNLSNEGDSVDLAWKMNRDEFVDWLDFIDAEGSVH